MAADWQGFVPFFICFVFFIKLRFAKIIYVSHHSNQEINDISIAHGYHVPPHLTRQGRILQQENQPLGRAFHAERTASLHGYFQGRGRSSAGC